MRHVEPDMLEHRWKQVRHPGQETALPASHRHGSSQPDNPNRTTKLPHFRVRRWGCREHLGKSQAAAPFTPSPPHSTWTVHSWWGRISLWLRVDALASSKDLSEPFAVNGVVEICDCWPIWSVGEFSYNEIRFKLR